MQTPREQSSRRQPQRNQSPGTPARTGAIAIVIVMIVCAGLFVQSATAAIIDYSIEEQGRVTPQRAEVDPGRVVVRAAGGDKQQDLLFDAADNVLYVVNHRDRSYLRIDQKVIDEVAALMDTVSGAVENQQGVLADLLGTLGLQGEESAPPAASLNDTGQQLQIAGISCRLYQSHRQGALESELCMTDNSQLGIDEREYATLRGFLLFANHMLNRAGPLIETLGLRLPRMDITGRPGLPIGMHSAPRKLKVRLSGIAPGGAAAGYRLPAGYSRSAIPFTSG